jgi:DNA modification methylase
MFALDRLICSDAATALAKFPEGCVDLILTSPPYWDAVNYGDGRLPQAYESCLDGLDQIWLQCGRVLWPNAKLAINTAIMPIPKSVIQQKVRHLKPIPHDIHHRIMAYTGLELYDVIIWQKQTTSHMLGAYPYPGNNLADNSIEHISSTGSPKPPIQSAPLSALMKARPNSLARCASPSLASQVNASVTTTNISATEPSICSSSWTASAMAQGQSD